MRRLINSTIDKDKNIVVTIRKYGWLTCLIHSFWGFGFVPCLVGTVVLIVNHHWWGAGGLLLLASFLWVKAWLHSNDKLKGRIYLSLLKEYIRKSCSEEEMPVIIKFEPGSHVIETMMKNGELRVYKVERMMEDLPLYAVKIHTIDCRIMQQQDRTI